MCGDMEREAQYRAHCDGINMEGICVVDMKSRFNLGVGLIKIALLAH